LGNAKGVFATGLSIMVFGNPWTISSIGAQLPAQRWRNDAAFSLQILLSRPRAFSAQGHWKVFDAVNACACRWLWYCNSRRCSVHAREAESKSGGQQLCDKTLGPRMGNHQEMAADFS
jgi:hypothetical protein